MRIVIDKDVNERKVLQESYEKNKPTYVVKAVNESDKFVYAKGLTINEAKKTVCELATDPLFVECSAQVVEMRSDGTESIIWSSDDTVMVTESTYVNEGIADWFKDKWNKFKQSNFARGFGALTKKITSSFKASTSAFV